MHRCIDVAVRRVVLHVQDVIHTVRDHPASSGKIPGKRGDTFSYRAFLREVVPEAKTNVSIRLKVNIALAVSL